MYTGKYFIEKLGLKPHPEGGWYCECLKAESEADFSELENYGGKRRLWTSIYFLLKDREISALHRLKSNEVWYYHSGTAMTIYMIKKDRSLERATLGIDVERGELPQILIPKGTIFGAEPDGTGYSLAGCMVSPGFEFEDFELLSKEKLLKEYPQLATVINRLAK